MEQQAIYKTQINNHINQLDPIRFKADLLYLAIAGMQRDDVSQPEDALASLQWMACDIAVELTHAILRMDATAERNTVA
jgi:hypothetical protein